MEKSAWEVSIPYKVWLIHSFALIVKMQLTICLAYCSLDNDDENITDYLVRSWTRTASLRLVIPVMLWVPFTIYSPFPIYCCIISSWFWYRPIGHQYNPIFKKWVAHNKLWERDKKLWEPSNKIWETTNKPWYSPDMFSFLFDCRFGINWQV